jgi:CheY-like chemotaxis protein
MLNVVIPESTDQAKILMVDDEPDLIAAITCRLEANGYGVLAALDEQEALEKATAEEPDLILLGNNASTMSGLKVLQRLRQSPGLRDIPVIMCATLCEPKDISVAKSCGVADYVTKPFHCAELMQKIENVLEERSHHKWT